MNQVILSGRCGKDAEVRKFDNGSIANVTLATTKKGYTTKDGKKIEDKTEWHNLVFRGAIVNVVEQYVKKGTNILVTGELSYREYESNGIKRTIAEINVRDMELLGGKSESSPQKAAKPAPMFEQVPITHEPTQSEDDLPF